MTARVIGITGPIGAGKSTVATMLRDLGAKVLDADAIAKDEQLRGTVGYSAIVQTFGTGVLGDDKEVDRRRLADIVFGDPRQLERLERILHPRVIARILEARSMLPNEAVLAVEAVKLLETSLRAVCDQVWVVLAPTETRVARLERRGTPSADAAARLERQSSVEAFRAAADVLIENDGDRAELRRRVREAWSARGLPTAPDATG